MRNRQCYQCGEWGHIAATCPNRVRRVSLTTGTVEYEAGTVERPADRPRVRLQGNMDAYPTNTEPNEEDTIRPEDSASQIGPVGTMSVVETDRPKRNLPTPPPPPQGSPAKIPRSRPAAQPAAASQAAPARVDKPLPPRFSEGPAPELTEQTLRQHQGGTASTEDKGPMEALRPPKELSSRRPTTPPKKGPSKPPPVKAPPTKEAKETKSKAAGVEKSPPAVRGSVRKEIDKKDDSKEKAESARPTQPRTPSPRRTVEAMNSPEVKAAVEAQSRHATRQIAAEQVLPLGGDGPNITVVAPPLQVHSAAGGGRLSAVTNYAGGAGTVTPTSPAGDSGVGQVESAAPTPSWSMVSPPATTTETCLCCQGSGMVSGQVNLKLFRLIASGQLRVGPGPTPQTPAVPPGHHGDGTGTEASPIPSEDSGSSRSAFHSGTHSVYQLSEDGTMTTVDSGGTVLFLELACGVDSVLQVACQEFGLDYIGVHAGLELTSMQRQVYRVLREFSERSSSVSGSGKQSKLIHIHISLPCTGGSPLLDLSKKDRKPAQEAYFRLLSQCGKYIAYSNRLSLTVVSTSLELPKSNRFWTDSRLLEFLSAHAMEKYADCSACAMGLSTSQGQPIGKVFRIACSDEVFATGLEKRFQCKCTQDHAPLNQVNYSMTERYSVKFARFFCRAISLRWLDRQEEEET